MTRALEIALHLLLLLVLPPLVHGVIVKTKAAFAGRSGAPVFQLWVDVLKLLRKGSLFSRTTSWVFLAGPVLAVAAPVAASLLVPFGSRSAPVSFAGDLVLFVYLLALTRFFTAAAALDTGSAFEGMGAAREVSWACLTEPAFFFGLLVLARVSGSTSLSPMLADPWTAGRGAGASLLLVLASWFVVLLAEGSRIPFDDPNTHLELTMVHEVMVLDHGGPAFGLVLWGAATKLVVLGALLLRVALPIGSAHVVADTLLFVAGMLLLGVVIGAVESVMARLRLVQVPRLLVTACLLSGFGMLLLLRGAP